MNTSLQVWPIPALQDNYIWCVHDGQSAVVVDPGESAPVISFLQQNHLQLTGILITHYHADHIGGIESLLKWHSSQVNGDNLAIPVYGPAAEDIPFRTRALLEGDQVEFIKPALALGVLEVPGHTLGHIAYFAQARGTEPPRLFCGDTLFASGCGRLFEGTPTQMSESLAKFLALPSETLMFCTHEYTLSNIRFALAVEPNNADLLAWSSQAQAMRHSNQPTLPTTLGHERQVNPFLRCDQAPVIQAASQHANHRQLKNKAEVLAVVRAWKDQF
ncbi:MAG: hydroxyacylglutathione hydrolase [Polynucleobacter sp.]|nr:hydroxyacylglutathione hydrolase [Polynucleobacter sp.]